MSAAPVPDDPPGGAQGHWLRTQDGLRLRALVWPRAGAKGTVLILPGRTEHAGKYAPVAARLGAAGYAAVAIDWRGQGLSDRLLPDPRRGHVLRFADYQRDLAAVLDLVRAEGMAGPVFLLTHSMGGCIGLRAIHEGLDVAAAAFSAPMWGILVPGRQPALFAPVFRLAATAGLRTRYAPPPASGPVCYVETAPFAGNSLTGDEGEWRRMQGLLRRNPDLCIAGPTIGWLAEALAECQALAALPPPPCPAVVGLGTAERIVDPAAVTRRMASWPGAELLRFAEGRHELLMERAGIRDAFLARIIALFDAAAG